MISELLLARITHLRSQGTAPLHRQLYDALRLAIVDGKLTAGDRLPSSRNLSHDLAMARNTVITAINQLVVEGYLVSLVGSGTYVSDRIVKGAERGHAGPPYSGAELSRRGQTLLTTYCASQLEIYPFTPGLVDFSAFPVSLWQRLQNKHWRMTYPDMLDYSYSGGYAPLRKAVANYVRVSRNVLLDLDQVIITSGTQQSLELCAQLLGDPLDTVWMEDPAYWGAIKAFLAASLSIHAVSVDEDGMAPRASDTKAPPRLIYVTPSHQYPTGAVMSLARRKQILAIAHEHKAWIVEDDYDSDFRFSGEPISSMAGLDNEGRVLYAGSFSKVLYPGLKLGYLVVPKRLVAQFKQAHYDLYRPGQLPLQAALAEFIEMGHFTTVLRHARQSYGKRRQCLLEALKPCLGADAHISGAEQGLHLCVRLPHNLDDKALARRLGAAGLTARPLSGYCLQRKDIRGLVIGYGFAPLAEIERYGPVLANLIQADLHRLTVKETGSGPDNAHTSNPLHHDHFSAGVDLAQ